MWIIYGARTGKIFVNKSTKATVSKPGFGLANIATPPADLFVAGQYQYKYVPQTGFVKLTAEEIAGAYKTASQK